MKLVRRIPGFLTDNEVRFLGTLAARIPAKGLIVEISSYKGKSTVMLAHVAAEYKAGPVVAVDPHEGLSYLGEVAEQYRAPTFEDFLENLRSAGVEGQVKAWMARSEDVARECNRPIRFLWIDGDHSYHGCKQILNCLRPIWSMVQ